VFKSSPTASQDLPDPIDRACREINAFIDKLVHAGEKIVQYKCSIGRHIAAIKKARPDDWEDIVWAKCNLRRSSAYAYIRIADGTETPEEQRAKNRERVVRHRALRNAQAAGSSWPKQLPASKPAAKSVTSFDVIGWWTGTSLDDRRHFIDSIGLAAVLEAMPLAWAPILERRVLGQVKQRRRREEAEAATPMKSVAIAGKDDGLDAGARQIIENVTGFFSTLHEWRVPKFLAPGIIKLESEPACGAHRGQHRSVARAHGLTQPHTRSGRCT
jgi:hypothetical protein